eukprot:scaffold173254_cov45-Prasinocladus_malaysianus.AAC.1
MRTRNTNAIIASQTLDTGMTGKTYVVVLHGDVAPGPLAPLLSKSLISGASWGMQKKPNIKFIRIRLDKGTS